MKAGNRKRKRIRSRGLRGGEQGNGNKRRKMMT